MLDLTGHGIKITQKTSSNQFFDMAGDGYEHLTAWAGAGNAVLFFDATGQGALTRADQVVFTDLDPSAKTDMQALLDVFDTNHDGKLDAGDASFADFFLDVTNANGTTSVENPCAGCGRHDQSRAERGGAGASRRLLDRWRDHLHDDERYGGSGSNGDLRLRCERLCRRDVDVDQ